MAVIDEIAAERRRQIEQEGWTPEHDDHHNIGELARAAGCYIFHSIGRGMAIGRNAHNVQPYPPGEWPWPKKWWKPTTPRRDLLKAAALIVAEIERLDRAGAAHESEPRHSPRPDR